MLHENNMHLTELQFYINNIVTFLGIVDLLYKMRQDYQWNNIIQCKNIFTSKLSTNKTTFTKTLFFYWFQRNIKPQQKLYSSLFTPQQKHDTDPVRKAPYLLQPIPSLHHQNNMCQKITLTTHPRPRFPNMLNSWKNCNTW